MHAYIGRGNRDQEHYIIISESCTWSLRGGFYVWLPSARTVAKSPLRRQSPEELDEKSIDLAESIITICRLRRTFVVQNLQATEPGRPFGHAHKRPAGHEREGGT